MGNNLKKIAVINFGGVGDLVIAMPFIRGFKHSFPESSISVICPQKTGGILRGQPYIDSLHMTDMKPLSVFQFILKMRRQRFDLAINMMPMHSLGAAIKMFLLFFLLHAKKTAGRNTENRGFFFDLKSEENETQMEDEMENHKKLLLAVGGSLFKNQLEYHIKPELSLIAADMMHSAGMMQGDRIVAINPGSDLPAKRWHIERYISLLQRLKGRFPELKFLVIGSKSETTLAIHIKEHIGESVYIFSGKTSLEVLPPVLKQAILLITNDSGPSHLARAIGVPVIVLVGPGYPGFLSIKSSSDSAVIRHQVPCAPCLKKECDDMKCWTAITVDEVFEQAVSFIERKCSR